MPCAPSDLGSCMTLGNLLATHGPVRADAVRKPCITAGQQPSFPAGLQKAPRIRADRNGHIPTSHVK